MGGKHTVSIVELLEQKFEENFKRLVEGGRTSASLSTFSLKTSFDQVLHW